MFKKLILTVACGVAIVLFPNALSAEISKGFEKVSYKKESGDFIITAEYPKFKQGAIPLSVLPMINREVERFAQQHIVENMDELKGAELTPEDRKLIGGAFESMQNSYDMTFEVIRADDQYVSVKFEGYVYFVGAAHGLMKVSVFNYDVKSKKKLQLEDVFEPGVDYLNVISKFVIKDLVRQLGKASEGGIIDGAAPNKDAHKVFSIGSKEITIYFQPYQVACYAAGAPKVSIPFSKLPGLLLGDESRSLSTEEILRKADALYEKDRDKARLLYARAAKKGSPEAYFALAYRYSVTPGESAFYYSEAAKKGHAEALSGALDALLFRANSLTRANPQRALELYRKAKMANPFLKIYDDEVKLRIIQMCVDPGEFDGAAFAAKYKMPAENDDEMYYVWTIAEEASKGGRFGKPDPKLILNLVCRGGWAPAELEAAVEAVYADWKAGTAKEFNICDYITSGGGGSFCSSRLNDEDSKHRDSRLSAIAGKLDAQGKQLLKKAHDSAVTFIEAKADREEGHGGSGRGGWIIDSEIEQKNAYLKMLEDVQKGFRPADKTVFEKADKDLNSTYRTVIAKIKSGKERYSEAASWEDVRAVQRLWIKYRDANAKLLNHMNPKVSVDVWKAWLTEIRVVQLLEA